MTSLAQNEKYLKRMIYNVTSLSKVKVLGTIMVFTLVFPGKQWWLDSGVFLPLWLFLQQFTGSLGLPSTWLDERTGLDLGENKLFDFCGCLWNNTKIYNTKTVVCAKIYCYKLFPRVNQKHLWRIFWTDPPWALCLTPICISTALNTLFSSSDFEIFFLLQR